MIQARARRRTIGAAGLVLLAAFQVAGTFGATRNQPERHDVDLLAIVIAIAGPLSLLAFRRFPLAVLWFISAITLGYLLRGYAYGPVLFSFILVMLAAVVFGYRYVAWATMGVVVVAHFAVRILVLNEAWSWLSMLGVLAWLLLVLVIGEVLRVRWERTVAARRAHAEAQQRQANEERLRIAHELHDVVAHHISLINVQAGTALHILDRKPEQAETALNAIKDASSEALSELRSLVRVLREEAGERNEAPRAPASMLDSLNDVVERSAHAGLHVDIHVEGERRRLASTVELAAFRIVQEAITNVVRHAHAGTATITLGYYENELVVQVDDDGSGGAVPTSEGSGIQGMRERAHAIGGSLDVNDNDNGGTRVWVRLPLEGAQ